MATPEQDTWEARIDAAARFIEAHLDDEPALEDIARVAHYSMFHFHRLFRARTGETVRQFAKRLRLERAAYRLGNTNGAGDLLTVAVEAGYSSHEAFTRAFTARFGVTPSAYRDDIPNKTHHGDNAMHTAAVRIERMETTTVAAVRHTGPYTEVGEAWKQLMKWGWTKMVFCKAATLGLCYDDPDVTPPDKLR